MMEQSLNHSIFNTIINGLLYLVMATLLPLLYGELKMSFKMTAVNYMKLLKINKFFYILICIFFLISCHRKSFLSKESNLDKVSYWITYADSTVLFHKQPLD